MDYARGRGYSVPAVEQVSDDGMEMVLERIDGPSMVQAIERRPWTIRRHGAILADLHRRLHEIPAPDFVPSFPAGAGNRLLHMDLHPLNVILGPTGPVVIDWTGACRGEPAADVGLAWLLLASGEVPAPWWKRRALELARAALVGSFLAGVDRGAAAELLGELVEWKAADPNMSPAEMGKMRRVAEAARRS
jgi:hypothetical protein